jgi:hypothetical protein
MYFQNIAAETLVNQCAHSLDYHHTALKAREPVGLVSHSTGLLMFLQQYYGKKLIPRLTG